MREPRRRSGVQRDVESGYVLFGIAIGLVILGISMTAAVPLWEKVVQRERESELIFRGYQYMQAVQLYQTKFPGAFPPTVDILVEQKFLRKAYRDPFSTTEEGEFRIIRQMSPELQQAAIQQQQQAGRAAGITDLNRSRARTSQPGDPQRPGGAGTGSQFQSTLGRGASGQSLGGIVGVASVGAESTFYKVPGKETYRDWLFVLGGTQAPVVTTPGGGRGGVSAPPSPFPGLPPPPGLTAFRFGPQSPGAQQPGAAPPGGAGQGRGVPPPGLPGASPAGPTAPNINTPGAPRPNPR